MKQGFIPVNTPIISPEAKHNVEECLRTGWISSGGPFVEQFEQAFAEKIGMRYGVAVTNGTAALHTALIALRITEGDEVIVPAFTMMASIFSIMYTGAKPVFVDCEPETLTVDAARIEAAITRRTKAIMPVHVFGHACDMDSILAIAKRHELYVVEDAAEAHGGMHRDRPCGSMGDISAFSFYANKIITTGEGGMALTNDASWAKRMKRARDLFHSEQKRFIHEEMGCNYRMTNIQAAIGLGQLRHMDEYVERKIEMAERYKKQLKDVKGIRLPATRAHVKNVYWMFGIRVDKATFGMDRDVLCEKLKREGVDTRDFFYSPTQQPVLTKTFGRLGPFPVSDHAGQNGCYLPSGLAITDAEIDRVIQAIKKLKQS